MHVTDQRDYGVRFEWGERGLVALAARGTTHFVIVDVLSLSTCVASSRVESSAAPRSFRTGGKTTAPKHVRVHTMRSSPVAPLALLTLGGVFEVEAQSDAGCAVRCLAVEILSCVQ